MKKKINKKEIQLTYLLDLKFRCLVSISDGNTGTHVELCSDNKPRTASVVIFSGLFQEHTHITNW